MKNIILIAAIGKNNELGHNNNLIWRIKEDLKFFKDTTEYHTIVMGRKTYDSLPHLLSNRLHIVLTSGKDDYPSEVVVSHSLEELKRILDGIDDDIYVIGGESLYRLFMDIADMMLLTEIDDKCVEADAYFPNFNNSDWHSEVIGEFSENNPAYLRKIYRRR